MTLGQVNSQTTLSSRIDSAFEACRAANRAAMIYYITAGFPDAEATEEIVDSLVAGGCDVLELGLPFSDPLADGPTIQHSSFMALKGGARVGAILESAARIREKHPTLPIVIFTAYNLVFHYGDEAFAAAAAHAGADALLVPDLPPEEAADLRAAATAHGLQLVFLVAPTTTDERARLITAECGGFVYYVSLKGVTGARANLADDLRSRVDFLKGITEKPIAVGFGVSTPEQTREIAAYADGVVIGSALIKLIGETPERSDIYQRVQEYATEMRAAAGR